MSITFPEAGEIIGQQRAVDRGWAEWRRAMESEWPRGDIGPAVAELRDALETYGLIRDEVIHPASAFPELESEAEAFAMALSKAAEDITGWADEVVRLLPAAKGETE